MTTDDDESELYSVVVNHEEQYSIWPADRECPLGWKTVGVTGPKSKCLEYIGEVWTDMRPLSLRKQMALDDREATQPKPASTGSDPASSDGSPETASDPS
jgi:MbtH protein